MAGLKFSIVENGYSMDEVEKYIKMLQDEYNNAVEWSNEIEKRLDEFKSAASFEDEISLLRDENARLLNDCRTMAATLRELTDEQNARNNEVSAKIIEDANIKADIIIKNARLKSDSQINEAKFAVSQIQDDIDKLLFEKSTISGDIEKLNKTKNEILDRIGQARAILDFS